MQKGPYHPLTQFTQDENGNWVPVAPDADPGADPAPGEGPSPYDEYQLAQGNAASPSYYRDEGNYQTSPSGDYLGYESD
jgi:hypothetical protein